MLDIAIDDSVIINSRMAAALQELDIMFDTANTDLIGYPDFGTNFEQFSWAMTPMTSELENYIKSKINTGFYLSQMDNDVYVKYIEGTERSIYYVNIDLYDKATETYGKREYRFY